MRAVYRVLDALRWDSGSAQDRVTVNLLEWGERLSIYSTEPDKIRRVLQPAHEELTARGILLAVEIEGRGKAQNLTYVFSPVDQLPDPELLRALTRRGMYPAVAGKYLTDHPDPQAVQLALRRFDAYPSKKLNAGALLRDMLVNPERYAEVSLMPIGVEARPESSALPAQLEAEQSQVETQQLEELQALSPEKQLSRLEHHLTFARITPQLSVIDRDRLRRAVLEQQVSVVQLVRAVVRNIAQDPAEKAAAVVSLLPS